MLSNDLFITSARDHQYHHHHRREQASDIRMNVLGRMGYEYLKYECTHSIVYIGKKE